MPDPADGFITTTALLNGATFVTTDDRILTGGHAAAARCTPMKETMVLRNPWLHDESSDI